MTHNHRTTCPDSAGHARKFRSIGGIPGRKGIPLKCHDSFYEPPRATCTQPAGDVATIAVHSGYRGLTAPGLRDRITDLKTSWLLPGRHYDSGWGQQPLFCGGFSPSISDDPGPSGTGPDVGATGPAIEFIDPRSDVGFKYLFGSEPRKEFLISLLQSIFKNRLEINDIVYRNTEYVNNTHEARSARFDVQCTSDKGDEFIIEMQQAPQTYFKDRANYYTGLVSSHCAKRGNWNYKLPGIHFVGILGFMLDDSPKKDVFTTSARYDFPVYDVSSHKQIKAFLQLPEFGLEPSELKTDLHRWMYLLKHLGTLKKIPVFSHSQVFKRFLDIADISTLSKSDQDMYKKSLEQKRSEFASLETARETGKAEGKAEGRAEERAEIIRRALASDTPVSVISKILGIDLETIKEIEASLESSHP